MQQKLNLATQVATLVSVVLGLSLVVWELRQSRELVRAELVAGAVSELSAQAIGMMGEGAAATLAKACDKPESLTTTDMIVLTNAYALIANRMRRLYEIESASDEYLAGSSWQRFAGNLQVIFATEFGRWWWKNYVFLPSPIKSEGDRLLETLGPPGCSDFYADYRRSLQ